jgi:molybdenum-dependent DNA-binding transcriptional regulator ModE
MVELGAEAAGELIERRWFALLSAIRTLQGECETLLEASKLADIAYRRACVQRAEFETLRDALEEQISARPSWAAKQATRLRPEARSGYRGAGKHEPAATSGRSSETARP